MSTSPGTALASDAGWSLIAPGDAAPGDAGLQEVIPTVSGNVGMQGNRWQSPVMQGDSWQSLVPKYADSFPSFGCA